MVEPRQAWQFTGSDPVPVPSDFSCNNGDVLRKWRPRAAASRF